MYDPQLMRFTARDPVKGRFTEPLTLHKYLYCANDPLNRIDLIGSNYEYLQWLPEELYPYISGFTVAVASDSMKYTGSFFAALVAAGEMAPDLLQTFIDMVRINNFIISNDLLDGESYYWWISNEVIDLTQVFVPDDIDYSDALLVY